MTIVYTKQLVRGDLEILKTEGIKPNFSELARQYGMDRHTIAKYWKLGKIESVTIDRSSPYDEYFDEIKAKLEDTACTKKALFKFFQKKYGEDVFACYSTFAHYLQRKKLENSRELKVHPRYETGPGIQLQLDWKEDLSIQLKDGEVIDFNLFVATFGFSRYHYLIYSKTKTTADFLRCLIECLERAGGKPKQLLTDNMSAVVSIVGGMKTKHPIIKQFEKDIGVHIHLCKCRSPQTKGKVESANRFVQWLSPYNNELETEDDLIRVIGEINDEVNKEVNQTTGIPPVKLIKKEMESLDPLPNAVMIDSYVEDVIKQEVPETLLVRFRKSEYSVPKKFIGKTVKLVPIDNKLYVYFNTELITVHDITNKHFNYHENDYFEAMRQVMPESLSDDEIQQRAQQNLKAFEQLEDMKNEL